MRDLAKINGRADDSATVKTNSQHGARTDGSSLAPVAGAAVPARILAAGNITGLKATLGRGCEKAAGLREWGVSRVSNIQPALQAVPRSGIHASTSFFLCTILILVNQSFALLTLL